MMNVIEIDGMKIQYYGRDSGALNQIYMGAGYPAFPPDAAGTPVNEMRMAFLYADSMQLASMMCGIKPEVLADAEAKVFGRPNPVEDDIPTAPQMLRKLYDYYAFRFNPASGQSRLVQDLYFAAEQAIAEHPGAPQAQNAAFKASFEAMYSAISGYEERVYKPSLSPSSP